MALIGAILTVVGAAAILIDTFDRWRNTSIVIDGGTASTDFDAEQRKAKQRALLSAVGPMLVLLGAVLTVLAL